MAKLSLQKILDVVVGIHAVKLSKPIY